LQPCLSGFGDDSAGFITGLNAATLVRAAVWEYVYSFENLTQFLGRLARVRGQSGICSFITYPGAWAQHNRGGKDSMEVFRALSSSSPLDAIVYSALHTDAAVDPIPRQLQSIAALKAAVAGTKWCVQLLIRAHLEVSGSHNLQVPGASSKRSGMHCVWA